MFVNHVMYAVMLGRVNEDIFPAVHDVCGKLHMCFDFEKVEPEICFICFCISLDKESLCCVGNTLCNPAEGNIHDTL